jgi:hypothetical protein
MSLYHMLFGTNPASNVLLACLGITPQQIPRYRDCYIDKERMQIVIYTRTGGGNRDYYESEQSCRQNYPENFEAGQEAPNGPWNVDLRAVEGFVSDEDDDFDCTYAHFYYQFPAQYVEELTALADKVEMTTPSGKCIALLNTLNKDDA